MHRRVFRDFWQGHTATLGGSWVVISRVICRVTLIISESLLRGLITPLITTHEPPSNPEIHNL